MASDRRDESIPIWSVPNGRTAALSAASTSNHTSFIDTTRVDPTMAPGTSRRIESPHNGFNASVSRTVRDADGNVVHQDNWFSDYRAVNGVVVMGPGSRRQHRWWRRERPECSILPLSPTP